MTTDPIIIEGPEQSRINSDLPDFGLPPVVGVRSYGVFRASKDVPELTDKYGWTYHHHVDMAAWKGRLYVGWNTCERDEDIWPSRELLSTSLDGITWADPVEMFPQGVSTCLRMYFFLAGNGRMLMIAGLRTDTSETSEDRKRGMVVREIRADHTLGDVFTLQLPSSNVKEHPPMFDTSGDPGLIEAGRQLIADKIFLEQQDRGKLLGPRRMKWHDAAAWPGGKVPGDNEKWVCGKAFSFFERPDNTLVGVCKMGWVTTSTDNGETWSQPVVPPTLITGKAKVWSQRTSDGRYALVYNPSTRTRYPLIAVAGDDAVHFRDMRIVQGELPIQRYPGQHRSIGPQYTRGVSAWADDHSRNDNAMWLVYSMSKEDIWVSKVPLPIKPKATGFSEPWNVYQPKWAVVSTTEDGAVIECTDPYDYACVTKVLPASPRLRSRFDLTIDSAPHPVTIDWISEFGSKRAIRLAARSDGKIYINDVPVADYTPGEPIRVEVDADMNKQNFAAWIDGRQVDEDGPFAEQVENIQRIEFRTADHRGIGGLQPVPRGSDIPRQPVKFRIDELRIY